MLFDEKNEGFKDIWWRVQGVGALPCMCVSLFYFGVDKG